MRALKIMILAASLAVAGCDSAQEAAGKLALTAQQQVESGNYFEARLSILKAIAKRDDVVEYHLLHGRIEMGMQQPVNAFQAYSRALELDATNMEALQFVSELGLRVGRVKDSEDAADAILAITPGSARALLIKGLIALDRKRYPDAEGFADQILTANAGDEGGLILKARILATQGKRDEAITLLKEGTQRAGDTAALLKVMLEVYRAKGDGPAVIETFRALIPKSEGQSALKIDFANALYKAGKAAEARPLLAALIKEDPDNSGLLDQIVALWDEYDPAPLDPTELQVVIDTGSPTTRIKVGRFYLQKGDAKTAEPIVQPIMTTYAGDALGLYARILDALGQSPRAYAIAEQILQTDENNSDALLLRSEMHIRRNQIEPAVNDAQVVVRDAPLDPMGYIQLTRALAAESETWRARMVFEDGIKRLPQNYRLISRYVEFLYGIGDKTRAMSVAREFTIASPASLRAWSLYASACARAGGGPCATAAAAGKAMAQNLYAIDDAPGAPRERGLLGRL